MVSCPSFTPAGSVKGRRLCSVNVLLGQKTFMSGCGNSSEPQGESNAIPGPFPPPRPTRSNSRSTHSEGFCQDGKEFDSCLECLSNRCSHSATFSILGGSCHSSGNWDAYSSATSSTKPGEYEEVSSSATLWPATLGSPAPPSPRGTSLGLLPLAAQRNGLSNGTSGSLDAHELPLNAIAGRKRTARQSAAHAAHVAMASTGNAANKG
mmetsp:Transcript_55043/g.128154  ORF Transcript_55043/g.128154 Transcript_55043/m.128154 type:complete len:208 (+) Transcript_55043:527-1150(+)